MTSTPPDDALDAAPNWPPPITGHLIEGWRTMLPTDTFTDSWFVPCDHIEGGRVDAAELAQVHRDGRAHPPLTACGRHDARLALA